MSANKYPDWLREAASRGGKAKSAAKTAAARKANAARWRNHKPKRVTAIADEQKPQRRASEKSIVKCLDVMMMMS